jgi:hypothetical protein
VEFRKKTSSHPGSLSEAAEKAASRMRQLQTRLADPAAEVKRSPARSAEEETMEQMERELQEMFARGAPAGGRLRARVIEELAERILQEWDPRGLEDGVVERIVEKVMDRLKIAG